jgi:Holliday junction resolvase
MASIETRVLESEVQDKIIFLLRNSGFKVFRSTATRNGDPDLLASKGLVRLAIEIKANPHKRVGLWQCKRLIEYRNAGYHANVVFGVEDFLTKFGEYL